MSSRETYKQRVTSFQRSTLTIQLTVMLLGGMIFTLAVITRPVLRIVKPEYIPSVKWIVNVMVSASIIQILAAAYDIFSGCWKLIWPLYLGIAGTALTVILELTAIASSLFLYFSSLSMVNEALVHPWYWVECLKFSSCHERMVGYIHWYILPQVILAAITVFLQCITIVILGKLVRTIADRHKVLKETQEQYRDEFEEKKYSTAWKDDEEPSPGSNNNIKATPAESYNDVMRTPKKVQFADEQDGNEVSPSSNSTRKRTTARGSRRGSDENIEMMHLNTSTYHAHIHVEVCSTPGSIVTEDHGYIAGSRVSMDYDKP